MAYKQSIKSKKPSLKIYEGFETKEGAVECSDTMKELKVEKVEVRKINQDSGRLKYGVYLGGKESSKYV